MEMESRYSCGRRWVTWGVPCPWNLHQCRLMRLNLEGFTPQHAPTSEVADSPATKYRAFVTAAELSMYKLAGLCPCEICVPAGYSLGKRWTER